ncbi:MAG: hypothetical protein AAF688_01520 [Bacteroidota bacterium]
MFGGNKLKYIKSQIPDYICSSIILFCILFCCKSSNVKENEYRDKDKYYVDACFSYRIKTNKQITWSSINIKEANIELNQVRFCTRHPDVLGMLLFEELGHWNGVYANKEEKSVIIFWNDVKIEGIDKKFSYGTTSYFDLLSSIVVYDENDQDMLAPESEYRDLLLENFKKRINTYNTKVKSNYREYERNEIYPLYKALRSLK